VKHRHCSLEGPPWILWRSLWLTNVILGQTRGLFAAAKSFYHFPAWSVNKLHDVPLKAAQGFTIECSVVSSAHSHL
jgi:hypothetical protein